MRIFSLDSLCLVCLSVVLAAYFQTLRGNKQIVVVGMRKNIFLSPSLSAAAAVLLLQQLKQLLDLTFLFQFLNWEGREREKKKQAEINRLLLCLPVRRIQGMFVSKFCYCPARQIIQSWKMKETNAR